MAAATGPGPCAALSASCASRVCAAQAALTARAAPHSIVVSGNRSLRRLRRSLAAARCRGRRCFRALHRWSALIRRASCGTSTGTGESDAASRAAVGSRAHTSASIADDAGHRGIRSTRSPAINRPRGAGVAAGCGRSTVARATAAAAGDEGSAGPAGSQPGTDGAPSTASMASVRALTASVSLSVGGLCQARNHAPVGCSFAPFPAIFRGSPSGDPARIAQLDRATVS
jgi:hypothetical protein